MCQSAPRFRRESSFFVAASRQLLDGCCWTAFSCQRFTSSCSSSQSVQPSWKVSDEPTIVRIIDRSWLTLTVGVDRLSSDTCDFQHAEVDRVERDYVDVHSEKYIQFLVVSSFRIMSRVFVIPWVRSFEIWGARLFHRPFAMINCCSNGQTQVMRWEN